MIGASTQKKVTVLEKWKVAQVARGNWDLERQRNGHIRKGRWRRFWEEILLALVTNVD